MSKIFLYLYPIKEYTDMFLFPDDRLYDEWNVKRPLPILEECIEKRYRSKGYKVVYLTYTDREVYGLKPKEGDSVIFTDISFDDNSAVDENGNEKENFVPSYASEDLIIKQLGPIDELIVGGYHFSDCVRRVAEYSLSLGIPTLVDLDLTDLFFSLYKYDEYFKIDEYSKDRYREYFVSKMQDMGERFASDMFDKNYASPSYGFSESKKRK